MKTSIISIVALAVIFSIGGSSMIYFSMQTEQKSDVFTNEVILTEFPVDQEIVEQLEKETYPKSYVSEIEDGLFLEETIVIFNVPGDNELPWGKISGTINHPAPGHPVIIQFFEKLGNDPIHVAQEKVRQDGTFEYHIRVLDVTDGEINRLMDGDYFVKIFKVKNNYN